MNPSYAYGYAEPMVPPRRKRSLSTSRTEPTQVQLDAYGFPNRMRRNLSTDHIPNQYMFNNEHDRPVNSNFYLSQQQRYRQPYSSSGNVSSFSGGSVGSGPMPRLINPMSMQVPQSKMPFRPHQDYLKYAQGANLAYNPYTPNFNPTLMARPGIEPFPNVSIPTSIANAMARGRDPTAYSSKEQLHSSQNNLLDSRKNLNNDFYYGNRSPPERPPPPKYNSGLSVENLATDPYDLDSIGAGHTRLRDRSMSPSRLSPTEQRLYNVRRSTSPLPSALQTQSSGLGLSRSGSRSSLNQSYPHRLSRETSPVSPRSPSPHRSPYSFGSNLSVNRMNQPLTGATVASSTCKYTPRLSGRSSSALNSISARLMPKNTSESFNANASSVTNANSNFAKSHLSSRSSSNVSYSLDNKITMDTLQVPKGLDNSAFDMNNHRIVPHTKEMDSQMSESFTDHCDQYKSVTSKILSKKANRKSGEFGDVDMINELDNIVENQNRSFSPEVSRMQTPRGSFSSHNQVIEGTFDGFGVGECSLPNSAQFEHNNSLQLNANYFEAPLSDQSQQLVAMQSHRNDSLQCAQSTIRRSSSSNGLGGPTRKGSLPSDYIVNSNLVPLSDDWSREKVANMAHEARQRLRSSPNSTANKMKSIGTWFSRQFVFLLIAMLNMLLAYVFYNLLAILPTER